MALLINVLHKLKSKKGFVLVYALITLLLAMMVVALLVIGTTMFYKNTNVSVGTEGALASAQSGIDILEYRINEYMPSWYDVDELGSLSITNIEELRQKLQEKIIEIDNENKVEGSNKNAVKLLTADINYQDKDSKKVRDTVSSGVTIYVCKDGMQLSSKGELELLVVGNYILNSSIYYKAVTVKVSVDADEVDHTGVIKSIKLNLLDYKEGIEGGTDKWGKVQ